MPQDRTAAIVGVYEYPLRVVGPQVSALQIKAASAAKALEDAGFTWKDVDAVYDTGAEHAEHRVDEADCVTVGVDHGEINRIG